MLRACMYLCNFFSSRSPLRSVWAPTKTPAAPFSPISPSLTLMNPSHNSFWSRQLPQTPPTTPEEVFSTPNNSIVEIDKPVLETQNSNCSVNSDIFGTPDSTLDSNEIFNSVEIRKINNDNKKSTNMSTITEHITTENYFITNSIRSSLRETKNKNYDGVIRSKSDYEILIKNKLQKNIVSLSPLNNKKFDIKTSTPKGVFKIPGSPVLNHSQSCGTRAISLNSLRHSAGEQSQTYIQQQRFVYFKNEKRKIKLSSVINTEDVAFYMRMFIFMLDFFIL